MCGFLVCGRRLFGAIPLDQHEPRRVVLLLNHVEPGDAGLFHAFTGVSQRGCLERLDAIRPHMHVDMNEEHDRLFLLLCGNLGSVGIGLVEARLDEWAELVCVAGLLHLIEWDEL